MEITLEKIELVKDRTGVSYKEAKDALEAADGSVVDAIIAIEDSVDVKPVKKAGDAANETLDKIKELVKKGNIAKITIRKEEEILLNLPLNAGIVGALLAPWGVIAGIIAAFGFKCTIELTKDDGTVVDISQRAETLGKEVMEKGSVVVDDVTAKGAEAYRNIKNAAADKVQELKHRKDEVEEAVCEAVEEAAEAVAEKAEEAGEAVEHAAESCEAAAAEAAEAAPEKPETDSLF